MVDEIEKTQDLKATLIDFGLASKFTDCDGNHCEKPDTAFKGNLMFASVNQLEFKQPSRRDDLISLCYMLLFVINDSVFPCENSSYEPIFNDNSQKY